MNLCIAKRMGKDVLKVAVWGLSVFYALSGFGWLCVYFAPQNTPPITIWDYFGIGLMAACVLGMGIGFVVIVFGMIGTGIWNWYGDSRDACDPPKITGTRMKIATKKRRYKKEMIFGPGPQSRRRKK